MSSRGPSSYGADDSRYDRRGNRRAVFALSLVCAGILIGMAAGATDLELPVAGKVTSLLVALMCVAAGVGYLRMRLTVNSSGLRVRNFASSWEANWIEIERFERPDSQYSREGFRHPGIAVHFRDGRREHIGLFAPARYNSPDFADDVVGDLNARVVGRSLSQSAEAAPSSTGQMDAPSPGANAASGNSRPMPWWFVLFGYVLIPWWGALLGVAAMSLLVIAAAAALGVPAGEVAGVVIAAGVVSLGTLALVRWRSDVDWDDLYRKLQARDFGDPLN